MANPQGTPIWYELLSGDADQSRNFYQTLVGWTIADKSDMPGMDYRMIDTGGGDFVGGMMPLTEEMRQGGASPGWLFYIGVDDVDATAARVKELGGAIHMEPFDIPGAGRAAMVADPQGNPFYIMRGSSPEASTAWSREGMGKCNWNELATSDQAAGNRFYADLFGWTYPDKMTMPGDMGDYMFIDAAGQQIGATMTANRDQPTGWQFYFRVPDITAAAEAAALNGGEVLMGPVPVPGGDMIIVVRDPQGARFGLVAAEK